jgi:hypothetical protein
MPVTMTPTVRPLQVWADNDKRSEGRKVRVVSVDDTHAIVEAYMPPGVRASKPLRRTRIRLDRFRPISTPYRLVEEAPEVSDAR